MTARRSARREEEATVRRDVAADLEHDLRASAGASTFAGRRADGRRRRTPRRGRGTTASRFRSERLSPDAKQAAERRRAVVVDDAARVERPDAGAAASGDDLAEPAMRAPGADPRRDDDHVPPREELDVDARTCLQMRLTADEACGRRPRRRAIARSRSDRSGHRTQHCSRSADRQCAQVHRRQAMRAVLSLLVCAARRRRRHPVREGGRRPGQRLPRLAAGLPLLRREDPARTPAEAARRGRVGEQERLPDQGRVDLEQLRPRLGTRALREAAYLRAVPRRRGLEVLVGRLVRLRAFQDHDATARS